MCAGAPVFDTLLALLQDPTLCQVLALQGLIFKACELSAQRWLKPMVWQGGTFSGMKAFAQYHWLFIQAMAILSLLSQRLKPDNPGCHPIAASPIGHQPS